MRELYEKFAKVGEDLVDLNRSYMRFKGEGSFEKGDAHDFVDDPDTPLHRAARSCEYAYRIMFAGVYSGGKSALINSLLEHEDLLPSVDQPLTGVVTYIRKANQASFRAKWLSRENCYRRFNHAMQRYKVQKQVLTPKDLDTLESEAGDLLDSENALADIRAFSQFVEHYDEIIQIPATYGNRHMFLAGGGFTGGRYYDVGMKDEYLEKCERGERIRFFERIWLAMIDETTLELDNEVLGNDLEIIDSPGAGAFYEIDEERSREILKETDAVVVVSQDVGGEKAAGILRRFIDGIVKLKRDVDRNLSLRGELTEGSVADRVCIVWNKIDRLRREEADTIIPTFFKLIPLDNPQVFFTSSLAAFDTGTRRTLREKFAEDGGGTRFGAVAEALKRVAGDEDPGGVGTLRRHLVEFGQERAHFLKLTDVRDVFDMNIRSMEKAISNERVKVEVEYGDPDLVRRNFLQTIMQTTATDVFGTRGPQGMVAGRLDVFRDGYIAGTEKSPYAQRVNGEFFWQECRKLCGDLRAAISQRMTDHFDEMLKSFVPNEEEPEFTFRSAEKGLEKAIRIYRQELPMLAQEIFTKRIDEKFLDVLGYDALLERVRMLLPLNQDRLALLTEAVKRYRDLISHSIGARVSEEMASATPMASLPLDPIREAEVRGQEALVKAAANTFKNAYLVGHLTNIVLPHIEEIIHRYLRYDLERAREHLQGAWSQIGNYVLQADNLRCIDLKELLAAEEGNERMMVALKYLRLGEFMGSFRDTQAGLAVASSEVARLAAPGPRAHIDWLAD